MDAHLPSDNQDDDVKELLTFLQDFKLSPQPSKVPTKADQQTTMAKNSAKHMPQLHAAVHHWMQQLRAVVDCERLHLREELESYQNAVVHLEERLKQQREELENANRHHQKMEERFYQITTQQQERIKYLEQQLGTTIRTSTDTPVTTGMPSQTHDAVASPSNDRQQRQHYTDPTSGTKITQYSNGSRKFIHPDGSTVIHFANGDIQTIQGQSTAYYFADSQVTQCTQPDGTIIYRYANGQVEQHQGTHKVVAYPDGTTKTVYLDNNAENEENHQTKRNTRPLRV